MAISTKRDLSPRHPYRAAPEIKIKTARRTLCPSIKWQARTVTLASNIIVETKKFRRYKPSKALRNYPFCQDRRDISRDYAVLATPIKRSLCGKLWRLHLIFLSKLSFYRFEWSLLTVCLLIESFQYPFSDGVAPTSARRPYFQPGQ